MDNPNIYNIKGDNSLSLGLQPLITRNAIIILFFQSGFVIVFTVSEIIIIIFYISFFFFYKTKDSSF